MKSHIDLIATGTAPIAADGTGPDVSLDTAMMLTVSVDISAVAGSSTPTLFLWLEHKDETGDDYFPLPYDHQLTAPGTISADATANTGKKNIQGTAGATAAGRHVACYKHVPSGKVRLRWAVTGSYTAGQGFTVEAGMDAA